MIKMERYKIHKIWTAEDNIEQARILCELGLYVTRWFSCCQLKELREYFLDTK